MTNMKNNHAVLASTLASVAAQGIAVRRVIGDPATGTYAAMVRAELAARCPAGMRSYALWSTSGGPVRAALQRRARRRGRRGRLPRDRRHHTHRRRRHDRARDRATPRLSGIDAPVHTRPQTSASGPGRDAKGKYEKRSSGVPPLRGHLTAGPAGPPVRMSVDAKDTAELAEVPRRSGPVAALERA